MKKKKKKRKINYRNVFIALIILLIIISVFYYAINMPIKNIYIKNNNIISDSEIIHLSGINDYPSFLLTSRKKIKKALEKNEYITKVKVNKKVGNIIEIKVYEVEPIALTKENKIITNMGKTINNNYNLSDIPTVTTEINDINTFADKFSKINKSILRQISEIEYSPVEVDNDRYKLFMNDRNIVYITITKITKLNKYNSIKDKLEGRTGTIYLDSGDYVELNK